MTDQKFKLCITMAGAVSAGAYTAGVIDYLLETLHLWEQAKQKNLKLGPDHPEYDLSLPMHDVEIDVLSGASAGGITGTLAMLNLANKKYLHVNKDNPSGDHNLFYKSWIHMADDEKGSTFEKLLNTGDLPKNKLPESLLNTSAIEEIANKALKINTEARYPNYVSSDLDLILTTSNLRGINFKVDFSGSNQASNIITNHGGFFRYKIMNSNLKHGVPEDENSLYYVLDLNLETDVNYLKDATLSTAAFPIGLKSREIEISSEYIKRFPKYLFGMKKGITPMIDEGSSYRFNSIDGGLINNEPYGIGLKVLKEKNKGIRKNDNYAVIMVDPFPNQDHAPEEYNPQRDMISIAKGMFKALRNQVMFNQDGILDALSLNDRTKFLIAPSRKVAFNDEMVRVENHLASSPLSGFSGFLDASFRKHDFELGRKNCQDFLRYYFAITPEETDKRLNAKYSKAASDRFSFTVPYNGDPKDKDTQTFLPIIPDMRLLHARTNTYNYKKFGADAGLGFPPFPQTSIKRFEEMHKKQIKKRVRSIVERLTGNVLISWGYRLFFQKKAYKIIRNTIESELKNGGLIP